MSKLSKKVRQELKKRPRTDWSNTKPPKQHAVYAMIRNLNAAGTDANNTPKRKEQ